PTALRCRSRWTSRKAHCSPAPRARGANGTPRPVGIIARMFPHPPLRSVRRCLHAWLLAPMLLGLALPALAAPQSDVAVRTALDAASRGQLASAREAGLASHPL